LEARAGAILEEIERTTRLRLDPPKFQLQSQSKSGRKPGLYIRTLFAGVDNSPIRILLAEDEIPDAVLQAHFPETPLLIVIRETSGGPARFLKGPLGRRSCRIDVPADRVERIIEDVIIDVSLGHFFASSGGAVSQLVKQESLDSLFLRKARFASERNAASWISVNEHTATYATLASLNMHADDDIAGRAQAAFNSWTDFISTLQPTALAGSGGGAGEGSGKTLSGSAAELRGGLSQVPKLGGNLPISRIVAAARLLSAGKYWLVILRRASSTRKSSVVQGRMRGLFRPGARVNSFVIIPEQHYLAGGRALRELVRSGHIFAIKIEITTSEGTTRLGGK
jgi:hypothetical protein